MSSQVSVEDVDRELEEALFGSAAAAQVSLVPASQNPDPLKGCVSAASGDVPQTPNPLSASSRKRGRGEGGATEWQFVTIAKPHPVNPTVKCNFCDREFVANTTKIANHILTGGMVKKCCPKFKNKTAYEEACKKLKAEANAKKADVAEKKRRTTASYAVPENSVKKFCTGSKESFAKADAAVADWVFGTGSQLCATSSDLFDKMITAVGTAGAGYKPPKRNKLSTVLLDDCYKLSKALQEAQIEKELAFGITMASDGWKSCTNRSLINVMLCTIGGVWFQKSVDATKHRKRKDYIADLVVSEINKFPNPSDIVFVAMDGAVRHSLPMIEEKCPWVTGVICTSHAIDLLLQDVGDKDHSKKWSSEFTWVQEEVRAWEKSVMYVRNHGRAHELFKSKFSPDLDLIRPAPTRFATNFLLGARLFRVKSRLQQMVVSQEWEEYLTSLKPSEKYDAGVFKDRMMDEEFWNRGSVVLEVYRPLFGLLKLCDGDAPSMGSVYSAMANSVAHVDAMEVTSFFTQHRKNKVLDHIEDRWVYLHSPAHSAGFCLNPHYHGEDIFDDEELGESMRTVAGRIVGDHNVLAFMDQYENWKETPIQGFAAEQLKRPTTLPCRWWKSYGARWPLVQRVGMRLMAGRSSATTCERNWSAYGYIWDRRRNRLDTTRAEKLVYVFTNSKQGADQAGLMSRWTQMRLEMQFGDEMVEGETYDDAPVFDDSDDWVDVQPNLAPVDDGSVESDVENPDVVEIDLEALGEDDVQIVEARVPVRRSARLQSVKGRLAQKMHDGFPIMELE